MKAVLLNSGGIDSRVAAAMAQMQGFELHSIYIDYNHVNYMRAQPAAQNTATLYAASHEIIPFPADWMMEYTDKDYYGFPYLQYLVQTMGATYAYKNGIGYVLSGIRDSYQNYWLDDFVNLLAENTFMAPPSYLSPLRQFASMSDVVTQAQQLNVPLNDTVSCTRNPACGHCVKCVNRQALGLPIN